MLNVISNESIQLGREECSNNRAIRRHYCQQGYDREASMPELNRLGLTNGRTDSISFKQRE